MKLTQQQVFNKILEGIRAQGGAATHPQTGKCRYRADHNDENSRRCAVGLFLSAEDAWDADEEAAGADAAWVQRALGEEMEYNAVSMMVRMQEIHDACAVNWVREDHKSKAEPVPDDKFLVEWEEKMKTYANVHNLDYTP